MVNCFLIKLQCRKRFSDCFVWFFYCLDLSFFLMTSLGETGDTSPFSATTIVSCDVITVGDCCFISDTSKIVIREWWRDSSIRWAAFESWSSTKSHLATNNICLKKKSPRPVTHYTFFRVFTSIFCAFVFTHHSYNQGKQ